MYYFVIVYSFNNYKSSLYNLPPDFIDDGSTAKTATRLPLFVNILPKDSMKVLLPDPGGPDKPNQNT